MKIAHLTTVHTPFDTRIFHKECVTLVKSGFEVVLVCCTETDQVVNGVRLHALPKPRSRLTRVTATMFRMTVAAFREKADVYHYHDPELIPLGLLLRLFGRAVVYDVHEDVPLQFLNKTYMPRFMRVIGSGLARIAEKLAGMTSSRIVSATPYIAGKFAPERTITVQNFPLVSEFEDCSPDDYLQREANFVYVGAISRIRGVVEIIKAIALLPESCKAKLLLAGNFPSRDLEEECRGLPGWSRVEYLGWIDRPTLALTLGRSRAGLVTLYRTRNYEDSYPVKLFEYMASRLPSIATDFPLWRSIVEDANCGILVDPSEPEEIAAAMLRLLDDPDAAKAMGENGYRAAVKKYNWEKEAQKLIDMYRGLCSATVRPAQQDNGS